jgi:hypothetical protein
MDRRSLEIELAYVLREQRETVRAIKKLNDKLTEQQEYALTIQLHINATKGEEGND